jgi:hypothetical protein
MKCSCSMTVPLALVFFGARTLIGQEIQLPTPGPELDVLKADVGTWDVEIQTWVAPASRLFPGAKRPIGCLAVSGC